MSHATAREAVYDDRVTATLQGLAAGKSREELAQEFGLSSWKSLDIYLRRKGFVWDRKQLTYLPATSKIGKLQKQAASIIPVKADRIIRLFAKKDADPKAIAQEMGFSSHRELAQYMEQKGLQWDSEKKNYVEQQHKVKAAETSDSSTVDQKVVNLPLKTDHAKDSTTQILSYLPLLQLLEQNQDRLLELLLPTAEGNIPKYAVPGVPKTKSIYMSELLSRLVTDFSQTKNLSQRDVVEAALVEYLKRYGYGQEVEILLQRK